MRPSRLPTILLGLVTVAATVTAVPGTAHALPAKTLHQAGGPATTLTLITGDRVAVRADGGVTVTAGPGRAGMRFLSRTVKTHQYVYPADALPLLHTGRVDERLFDVTALTALGYTDRAVDLPLLVGYPKTTAAVRAAVTAGGAKVVRDLPVVHSLAVRADRLARGSLWSGLTRRNSLAPGVDRIWLDGKRKINLDVSVPQIGAPEAWKAGLDGAGVTVAILDTGIDATHPDLAGQIKATRNFTDTPDTDDTVGHGTHVASIIAGTGAASGGKYRGVAPGAKLLIGKVCGTEFCADSDILAGMAWAAPQAPVINMSLGGGDLPTVDPLEEAVNTLTAQYDTLFVIAAGNSGSFAPVSSPATADAALAVGAVDDQDQLADFSSKGPRTGDGAIKPDITAPGVDIIAAKAKNGVIGDPAPNDAYTSLSGTSMATPHVAGSAAILAQQHPGWTSKQRKTALMGSAETIPGTEVLGQGAGRVDVAREITQSVEVDEGSVSFGVQQWPHADDTPVTRTVTYRNLGTAPVALALAVGGDAPTGMISLGATSLTVPAGGTAATTMTADTRVGDTDGVFDGYLTATASGGVQVKTPYAVNREVESYDVTLKHTNRDGTPSTAFFTVLLNPDSGDQSTAFGDGETVSATVRVPKGNYGLFSWITVGWDNDDPADDHSTMLVETTFTVDRAATVDLDARRGKPYSVKVPDADAAPTLIAVNAEWHGGHATSSASLIVDRFDGLYAAQLGSRKPVSSFVGSSNVSFAKLTAGAFLNSPYVYDLAWFTPGTFSTGLRKTPQGKDLATIHADYATEAAGVQGSKSNSALLTARSGYWSVLIPFDLPFSRTEYVNVDGHAQWQSSFSQIVRQNPDEFPAEISVGYDPLRRFTGGQTYEQQWNRAVFAPAPSGVTRRGDTITVVLPLYSDGAGHQGWSDSDTMHYALYSGDTLAGEFDGEYGEIAVPAGDAGYRLEATATRSAPHTFTTQQKNVWTFRSGHVGAILGQPVALSTVRISPQLDLHNAAPAGRSFAVGLTVEHQKGGRTGRVTAEASFDDGTTWHAVPVSGGADNRVATVAHPAGPGYVSLRVHASATGGQTVTTTVIRAYAIA